MSCQQVPRLTEDPYTFTEAAPVTATIFNPQINRLAPILSSTTTSPTQKQIITQKSQTVAAPRVIHQPINQHQQFLNARINGVPQIVNGIHKNVATTTISSKVQPQLQYQSAKIAGNLTTKKFVSPSQPVPSQNTITIHQTHPLYSVAKQQHHQHQQQQQNSIISAAPVLTSVPLPPLFQKTASASKIFSTSTSTQSPIPVDYNALQKNHSNTTSKSIAVTIRTSQTPPVTTLTNYGQRQPPQQLLHPNLQSPNVVRKQQQQQQQPPPPPQQFPAAKIPYTTTIDTKSSPDLVKRKSFESDSSVFVTPAKRDSRTVLQSGKKGIKIQSSPSVRTKRSYSQTSHHEALQRIPSVAPSYIEWHAPDSYIFDNNSSALLPTSSGKCDDVDLVPTVQDHWIQVSDIVSCIPMSSQISREQRIELRKAQLRRQAMQYISAQQFRTCFAARKRLVCVSKTLRKLRHRDETPPPKKCCFPSCINDALALTAYCYLHITRNSDQFLFLPCTAKFSDNSQCRVPVFDISHELPLCREHAWKRDNYNRIVQEQKPKKPPRKRPKPSAMTRPLKRNKKKRKPLLSADPAVTHNGPVVTKIGYQFSSEELNYVITRAPSSLTTYNTQQHIHQDMLSICENSSAYESSEDTGVGGLSESELMVGTHEIAEEIPLGDTRLLEEHDLTNVLNQLPVDAFNELFTTVQQNGPLEPTQEEQEDLERALEAVNKQVKSLQQLTGGDSNFLGDFLDVVDDQMLDETDITEVVLHSPSSSSIDADNIIISGGCNPTTTTDIRGLVQT